MAKEWTTTFLLATIAGLSFANSCPPARAQEDSSHQAKASSEAVHRLVSAKLIGVTPMPDNLDKWIIEQLRAWGKYRVTGDPEGADMVMSARSEDKTPQYKTKRGAVRPKKEKEHPPVLAVTVEDWVTKDALWHAEILNEKPGSPPEGSFDGPEITLAARGLSADQLGAQLVRKFREYVTRLEQTQTGRQ